MWNQRVLFSALSVTATWENIQAHLATLSTADHRSSSMGILTLISLSIIAMVAVARRKTLAKSVPRKEAFLGSNLMHITKNQDMYEKEEKEREKEEGQEEDTSEKARTRPIRLCITGFGSFDNYPGKNPSSMTARHLHGRVLSTSPSPISSISSDEPLPTTTLPSPSPVPDRKIEITFVGPVDVTYEKVALMVTELHQTDEFDAFVHVGVGRSGELRVEQRSRRVGYDKPGYDGRLCEIVDLESGTRGIKTWPMEGHKDEIRSKIDCDKLVKWLRSQMDVKHVLPSTDAGLYLCEYIYGMSLAQSILHTKSGDGRSPAPVLFVHVPTLKTDANSDAFYTESEVSEILERVCWWVGSTV